METCASERRSREDARGALVHRLYSGVGLARCRILDAGMLSRPHASSLRRRPRVLDRVSVAVDEPAASRRSRGVVELNEACDANDASTKQRFRPSIVIDARDER